MDVLFLHQAGFSNAVKPMGTQLTEEHIKILRKYTENVIISYDADSVGKAAARRAIPILRDAGISVKVVNPSPYIDPAALIKAEGTERFQKRLVEAKVV